MLTDSELEAMLHDIESDRVERKASYSDPDRVKEAICALANDLPNHGRPGVIFIGANDNGTPASLPITDDLMLKITGIRNEGLILPIPSIVVEKRSLAGGEMIVIFVPPSDAPPVRFRGRVWVRPGPQRGLATPDEERRLNEKRRWRDLQFDIHPVTSSTLHDLNLDAFTNDYLPSAIAIDVIEANQRSREQQLASLRFISTDTIQPTYLGILILGKDPRTYLPGAYIQFLRIGGTTLADPILDAKEIDGTIPEQLRQLDEVMRMNIRTAVNPRSGTVEELHPDYPFTALQQLARNAVMHRNYEGTSAPVRFTWFDDRVEILNPGGPYGQVTRDNFGQPGIADYRNPNLAAALKDLGFVQRFGVGIAIARQELAKNGNPPLEFIIESTHVLATIRRQL